MFCQDKSAFRRFLQIKDNFLNISPPLNRKLVALSDQVHYNINANAKMFCTYNANFCFIDLTVSKLCYLVRNI